MKFRITFNAAIKPNKLTTAETSVDRHTEEMKRK